MYVVKTESTVIVADAMVALAGKLIIFVAMTLVFKNCQIVLKGLISDDIYSVYNIRFSHNCTRLGKGFQSSMLPSHPRGSPVKFTNSTKHMVPKC